MKKTITLITFGAVILIAFAATPGPSSSGAPASHTGAPGEQTCASSGCHDDNKINAGTAVVNVIVGENETSYVPGQTYPIKVKITDQNVSRFGFQIVALADKGNKDLGTFEITDRVRTQIIKNEHKLQNRNYVTYTFNGTDAIKNGVGEWIVNWTAPKDAKEPVTFYVGAVSANDDMSDKGDRVYTTELTINSKKQ